MAYGDEMLNSVKAIKTALGGTDEETYGSELLNSVVAIKELVENGGGGGSSLPSYTDADEGKVLGLAETDGTVAPAWVNGGGGSGLPECGIEDIGKVLTVVPLSVQIPVFSNQSGTISSDGSVKISAFAINPVLDTIPDGKHGTFTNTFDGETSAVDVVYDSSTYSFSNDDFGLSIVFNNVFEDEAWIINGYGSDNEGLEVTATLKYDGIIYGATPSWQATPLS